METYFVSLDFSSSYKSNYPFEICLVYSILDVDRFLLLTSWLFIVELVAIRSAVCQFYMLDLFPAA